MSAISRGVTDSVPQLIPAVLEVAPDDGTVTVGATLQLKVEVRASSGALMEGVRVSWHSRSPRIARVNSSGLLTARDQGIVLIEARTSGLTGSAIVTVMPR